MNSLSICTIMKNEEKHLDAFLTAIENHLKSYDYEIILVDTGSTDHSINIATRHGIKPYHFEWVSDFSAARNYAAKQASNDLVLVLDCDEYIVSESLSDFLNNSIPKTFIGSLSIINHFNGSSGQETYTTKLPRMYRKSSARFEGTIHEQLVPQNVDCKFIDINLTVEHFGYAGSMDEINAKVARNADLLLIQANKNPNDPYTYFQLGQCYNMVHDVEKSLEFYEKAMSLNIDSSLEYTQMLITAYGYALMKTGRLEDALSLAVYNDVLNSNADYLCMIGLAYMRNGNVLNAMQAFLNAVSQKDCHTYGCNSFIPLFNMGQINELLGNPQGAIPLYEKCGEYEPALKRLHDLMG